MDFEAENTRLRKLGRAYVAGEATEQEYRLERRRLIEAIQQGMTLPPTREVPELGLVESTLPNPTGTMPVLDDETISAADQTMLQPVMGTSAGQGSINPWLIGGLFGLLGLALLALVVVAFI